MRHRTAAVLMVTIITAVVAAAQDPWEYRTSAGEWAFANGDHERAEAEFRGALELAQRLPPGDRRLETSLENLARLYEHQMRLDEAQPLYQLLVAAMEIRVGGDSPSLLDTLVAVARVSLASGDSPTAEASLGRYLEIAASSGVADSGQHWRVLSMLARMNTLTERHDEALDLQRRAVDVMAGDAGASGAERATELESLAQMELLYGSGQEAERRLVEAVELRVTEGHGRAADTLAGAAATALGAGEIDIAERLAERALSAAAADGSQPLPAHRVLADVEWMRVRRSGNIEDLVGAGADDPRLAAARERLTELVEAQRAELPPNHPDIAESCSRLARVAALRGDAVAAADWQRRYLDTVRGTSSETAETVLTARASLVALLALAGRTSEAAEENALLIGNLEDVYGPDAINLIPALERQQILLTEAGRKKEAKAIKKRLRKLSRQRKPA
jgi:tetratricopeptide (TPR) repeat protein